MAKSKRKAARAKPGDPAKRGYRCPKCTKPTRVPRTEHDGKGGLIRHRVCSCGWTFTTFENETNSVDGWLETVDSETLLDLILTAKRKPIPTVPSISTRTP